MDIPLETPSRIMRRIKVLEAQDVDLPSLPSFPAFDDIGMQSFQENASLTRSSLWKDAPPENTSSEAGELEYSLRYQSTPAAYSHVTGSTIKPLSTSSSATRFANSLRNSTSTRNAPHESFDVSEIRPTAPEDSFPGMSLPDLSLHQVADENEGVTEAHGTMHTSEIRSRTHSPPKAFTSDQVATPASKGYDYSIVLHSESKPSRFRNVSIRNPKAILSRTRTPSLTRTTPSPTSLSSNSTPRSIHSHTGLRLPSPVEDDNSEISRHLPSEGEPVTSDEISMELEDGEMSRSINQQGEAFQESRRGESTFISKENAQSSSEPDSERSHTPYPNAFSSIQVNQSTPAYPLQPKYISLINTPVRGANPDDFNTPYNRRRSFLLSLVQSSGRPRMTIPTPHPISRIAPTPRPRAHPLSQAWTPQLNAPPGSDAGSSNSPGDRNSFISTASSHDLTVHPRANASFDPVTGSKHVGRFNAVKLNNYLHGLNRRLHEENEMLIARLRMLGEEVDMGKMADELENNILEGIDEGAGEDEALHEEILKRESELEVIRTEHNAVVEELQELRKELAEERLGRQQDNDDWKVRLEERVMKLGSGFENEYQKLEDECISAQKQVKESEKAIIDLKQSLFVCEEDLKLAKQRAEKAEDALATSSDLGLDLKHAHKLLDAQKEEVRAVVQRAQQLEDRLKAAKRSEEQAMASAEAQIAELDDELRQALEAQQTAEAHAIELEQKLNKFEEQQRDVESELSTAKSDIVRLRNEYAVVETQLQKEQSAHVQLLQAHKQLENALEHGEKKMLEDEAELVSSRSRISRLEQEVVVLREAARDNVLMEPKSQSISTREGVTEAEIRQLEAELDEAHKEIGRLQHRLSESPGRKAIEKAKDVRVELLEKEKDDLIDRIRSLTAIVSSLKSTPADVMGQAQTPTPIPRRLFSTWKTPKTPGPALKEYSWLHERTGQTSSSPFVVQIHQLQHELHLANDSIDDKVNQLEEAGIGIVGLTERLEDALARNMALEKEMARLLRRDDRRLRRLMRIRCLECSLKVDVSTVVALSSNPDESSLEVSSISMKSDPKTPPSKRVQVLSDALKVKTSELDSLRTQWDAERKQLLGKNTVLQDAANLLNAQLDAAKNEAQRAADNGRHEVIEEAKARLSTQDELAKAKTIVTGLEESLRNERAGLRTLTSERNRMIREKETIFVQLQRAQSDMDEVRSQLDKVKAQNRELETELRATETVDQKARLLENKVAQNKELIEHLREERETLATDHANLQRMYQEASTQVISLRKELLRSQNAHDEHRHQLDSRVQDIEDLRRELSAQTRELERVQSEKQQADLERGEITRTVASLEADLKRVRGDAETLGKFLKELKTEHAKLETLYREDQLKAERVQKQLSTQIRLANEQTEIHRSKAKKAIVDQQNHVCDSGNIDLASIRSRHREECKGLLVQITYLKAKFTRESTFRSDLGYQKNYLLQLLSKFEKGEKQILAAIAKLDYAVPQPHPKPAQKRPTLRVITVMVMFIARARRAADAWREQSSSKAAITAALHDVRRRRITGPST